MLIADQTPNLTDTEQKPASESSPPSDERLAERAQVKVWCKRVRKAKEKWAPDFKRMRMNMEFCAGMQWPGMQTIDDEKYTCNWTVQNVNQKVASLYARNPKAEARSRKRKIYRVWDEKIETLTEAIGKSTMLAQQGLADPVSEAIILDYQQGKAITERIDGVCETLKLLYQYQIDTCRPEFKEQMKQCVRTAVICGVGYARPVYKSEAKPQMSSVNERQEVLDRVRRAKVILDKIEAGEVEKTDAQMDVLHSLFASVGASQSSGDEYGLPERLEYDFPIPTSVIPDERCRALKEWIGARYVAQEYILPLDEVNAFFETNIEATGELVYYSDKGDVIDYQAGSDVKNGDNAKMVCLWEIFDYLTKTHCFVVDGWKDYVLAPEALDPCVSGFYPIFALTFNDVVAGADTKTSIYPPSDVQLLKHTQKEWNRSREGIRNHRKANAPNYVVANGHLTQDDKDALVEAEPNQVIELTGVPLGTEPGKVLQPLMKIPIEPEVYDTAHLAEDMQLAGRVQEANIGPAQPNVTATVGTIAEQSRMTTSSSNVDDLDGFLTRNAKAGMEMMLRVMPEEIVKAIVGEGAVWPGQQDRESYLNAIDMEIQAASSGRPNKAMEIANMERLTPFLMQFGANPMAMIKELIKRLDDRLEPRDFFPVQGMPPVTMAGGQQAQGGPKGQVAPQQPLQQGMMSGSPVPLASA